jgi:predicted small metal-binding protein
MTGGGSNLLMPQKRSCKEANVPYSLDCRDAGQNCAFAVTTETEDELMQHVATHAAAAHPDMELTPETVASVKSLIRKS